MTNGDGQVSTMTAASIQTQTLPPGRSPPKGSIKIHKHHWPALWVIRAWRRVMYDPWTKSSIRQLTRDPGSALQALEERLEETGRAWSWNEWLHEEEWSMSRFRG